MYSLRQITMGAMASLTSAGVLRTPDGKAVADIPSLPGPAAGAAGMEECHRERIGFRGACVVGGPVAAHEDRDPEARRPFRRNTARERLIQAPEHHVGQHLADHVAGGDARTAWARSGSFPRAP